jgi:hypothetical protein
MINNLIELSLLATERSQTVSTSVPDASDIHGEGSLLSPFANVAWLTTSPTGQLRREGEL